MELNLSQHIRNVQTSRINISALPTFRLDSPFLGGDYKAAFEHRNSTNLIAKAAQLVADLESLRTGSSRLNVSTSLVRDLTASLQIKTDNGRTLPDFLRGQAFNEKA